MPRIAVVAHAGKSFGGGLGELREVLAHEGIADPLWYEVRKSRKAPKCARKALAQGAEVIFVWGGDGQYSGASMPWPGRGCPGDPASRHGQSAGEQPADSCRRGRSGAGRAERGVPPVRHRVGERRALRGDGRRRVRCPDRSKKPARDGKGASAARRTSTQEPGTSTRAGSGRTLRWTASASTRAGSPACWWGTWPRFSAGSRSSAGRGLTTGSSRSAWSPPRIRPSGRARLAGSYRAGPGVAVH